MKYFILSWLTLCMGCMGCHHTTPVSSAPPAVQPQSQPAVQQPAVQQPAQVYNDGVTGLSMSNSLDNAKVNDVETIFVQVKNTGNDMCSMFNVGIRCSQSFNGSTVLDSDISDGGFAIRNLAPGQTGTLQIKFTVPKAGQYTFYLTDMFGVFTGTNSTKHFPVPSGAKTFLNVN